MNPPHRVSALDIYTSLTGISYDLSLSNSLEIIGGNLPLQICSHLPIFDFSKNLCTLIT
jgi:hypothetical protein